MENKSGIKTSEFWLAVVGSIVTLLNQSGLLGDTVLPVEAILGVAGIIITYVIGRTLVKNGTAKANAIASVKVGE